MQETRIQSLGQEDSREEGMATHSSILAWRIPWTEEPGELQSMGLQRDRHDQATITKYILTMLPAKTKQKRFWRTSVLLQEEVYDL